MQSSGASEADLEAELEALRGEIEALRGHLEPTCGLQIQIWLACGAATKLEPQLEAVRASIGLKSAKLEVDRACMAELES